MWPTKSKIVFYLALYRKSLLIPAPEIYSLFFILTWNWRCALFCRLYRVCKCWCFMLVCPCTCACTCKHTHTHSHSNFVSFNSAFSLLLWQPGSLSSICFRTNSICFSWPQEWSSLRREPKLESKENHLILFHAAYSGPAPRSWGL